MAVNGADQIYQVLDIKDGKVIFGPDRRSSKPRWWLPFEYVKKEGVLEKP